jgi:dihydrofolate reductase
MTISLILATSENGCIGYKNTIPWMGQLPSDMRFFTNTTKGNIVCMGRKTYDSIGKALPIRTNIVISSNPPQKEIYDAYYYQSVESVLDDYYKHAFGVNRNNNELFVIGGASIYQQFLPYADKIYHTLIHAKFEGDAFFDLEQIDNSWKLIESEFHYVDEKNRYDHSFNILEKVR